MRYAVVEMICTGNLPDSDQILSVSAIVDDTDCETSIEDLPTFFTVVNHPIIKASPSVIHKNKVIFEILSKNCIDNHIMTTPLLKNQKVTRNTPHITYPDLLAEEILFFFKKNNLELKSSIIHTHNDFFLRNFFTGSDLFDEDLKIINPYILEILPLSEDNFLPTPSYTNSMDWARNTTALLRNYYSGLNP